MIAVFKIALRALRRNILRSFLTMLGSIVGISAVIVGVSMGAGAKAEVDKRIASMGQNLLLIFSGNMDPVTPPQRGEEVAHYLPNSRHVIIPEGGHGPFGLTNLECVDRIVIEFIDKRDAKNLDLTCIERMAPPPFVTEAR